MDKPTDRDELITAIEGDRYRVLEALFKNGELPSGDIRDYAELPEGSKHYQLSLLESWGLIKRVGSRHTGEGASGVPEAIYTITDDGRLIVREVIKDNSVIIDKGEKSSEL